MEVGRVFRVMSLAYINVCNDCFSKLRQFLGALWEIEPSLIPAACVICNKGAEKRIEEPKKADLIPNNDGWYKWGKYADE